MAKRRVCPLWLWLCILVFGAGFVGSARLAQAQTTITADSIVEEQGCAKIVSCIQAFYQDLELLRRFMGAPKANALDLGIRSIVPHDVYFQALTLFQETNQLSFEITRVRENSPLVPAGDIRFADILPLLKGVHQILKRVIAELRVAESGIAPLMAANAISSDPFIAILSANRQLNLLLEREFAPSDVYRQVTVAVGYASQLLASYPGVPRIPEEPSFEPAKQSRDVYLRLIECLEIIAWIFDALDLEAHKIEAHRIDLSSITPGDVFLVSSLIVSQLDFLHNRLAIDRSPHEAFYPGRKFPAHVYQRAGLLKLQLEQLEFLVSSQGAPVAED